MPDVALPDLELVRAARQGCPDAARHLYHRHSPRVFAVLLRTVRQEELARDLAQETWIRAFRALPRFREEARFSTWIHRIALNTALSELRRARAREVEETELVESLPAPRRRSGDVFLAQRLRQSLKKLPEGMRRILVLHDVHGHTHQEIAERLGISVGTSKSQLFRARAKMRDMLEGVAASWPDLAEVAAA